MVPLKQETRPFRALFPKNIQSLELQISLLKSTDCDGRASQCSLKSCSSEFHSAMRRMQSNAHERSSTGSRLDDDFAFHVRMDRAQIVIVARGRESERELGVLDESFRPEALAWSYHGMGHGLIVTQV